MPRYETPIANVLKKSNGFSEARCPTPVKIRLPSTIPIPHADSSAP